MLLAVTLVASGAGVVAHQALAPKERAVADQKSEVRSGPKQEPAPAKLPSANAKASIAYGGRVLGADGRPVVGAKLYLALDNRQAPLPEYARTGPQGRFQFTVPKAAFEDEYTVVAAAAANPGIGWVMVSPGVKRDDLTLRLVKDDVAITGQVVDLEGKPIPGVTLTVLRIWAAPGEDLGPWLEAVKSKKGPSLELEARYIKRYNLTLSPKATTDPGGASG